MIGVVHRRRFAAVALNCFVMAHKSVLVVQPAVVDEHSAAQVSSVAFYVGVMQIDRVSTPTIQVEAAAHFRTVAVDATSGE